ncbi:hypothetical protein EGR_00064 [Echinococcus granulosus]|uniref:Uncharacterized protein n=1 Tax=Echinococcus granulosus TaxID=6210 RepID=W6UT23_ECHGR|nr:hypothetical protein EGR_00064 [Echinococcus granulosus]EUB64795.1 hypothetical protein EGR_00064 [Echinococcus granulosus]
MFKNIFEKNLLYFAIGKFMSGMDNCEMGPDFLSYSALKELKVACIHYFNKYIIKAFSHSPRSLSRLNEDLLFYETSDTSQIPIFSLYFLHVAFSLCLIQLSYIPNYCAYGLLQQFACPLTYKLLFD